ncbi:hypothetical protein [Aestuariivirga sp.]|uniref:hypothetical protein n=1 Tax=Aestuariivirga sp. TaxID=2650926 RepID=UPI0039E60786
MKEIHCKAFASAFLVASSTHVLADTTHRFTTIVTYEEALKAFRADIADAEPNAPSKSDIAAIEQKLRDCSKALGGEVRVEDDTEDFRPAIALPSACLAPGASDVSSWFKQTVRSVRSQKLTSQLEEKSFKWFTYFRSIAKDASYDPLFYPERLIAAKYDSLPSDEVLLSELQRRKGNYRIVAKDTEAVKAFYSYARYKDYEPQKAYLLKHRKELSRIILAETDVSTDSGGTTGKLALLILADKDMQVVPIELVIVIQ